jgi:DNA (cytosine-5)-methyltransferase 1
VRLLDLFCGAGGAAMGYHRAGFDVVGVDLNLQPHYPFEFHQADAMTYPLDGFDAIHASPPCQAYTVAGNIHGASHHPDLVPGTRERLLSSGGPWVMENVPGSPLQNYIQLCGLTFGLGVKRHRWFECSFFFLAPPCPGGHPGDWVSIFGHTVLERSPQIDRNTPSGGPRFRRKHLGIEYGRRAMGINWMTREELSEAIPPAYTEYIGAQLIEQLQAVGP